MAQADETKRMLREAAAHYQAGRAAEAEELCRRVLAVDGDNADAHHLSGVLAMRAGRREAAAQSIRRAIGLRPGVAQYHNSLGAVYAADRQLAGAIHHFWQALACEPNYAEAMRNLARALREADCEEEAARMSQRAAALDPNAATDPATLLEEGKRHQEAGEPTEAIACFRRAIAIRGDFTPARRHLVVALDADARTDEAIAAAEELLAMKGDEPETLKNLAVLLMQTGRLEEATARVREALRYAPAYAEGWLTLSEMKRFAPGDAEIGRLESLCAEASAPADRLRLHFALGKACNDAGDYDRAFEHYHVGNSLQRQQVEYDPANTARRTDALIAFFQPERFEELGGRFAVESELPIFIVGMPRSGTTLVEQIIASHSAVHGAGELTSLHSLILRLPSLASPARPFPQCLASLPAEVGRRLAAEYVDALALLAPQARRVADKMPWNFFALGLAALFWPRAKIVHCLRDPMDTCVSCYTRFFATGQPFSCDLVELGHYYRQYDRLAEHWRKVLPLPVLEVRYEDLVTEQERVTREMIAFCDLEWDDRCLAFHETDRRIKTNVLEVRRPIFRGSVGRWHRYEAHLEPLRRALAGELEPEGL